MRKILIIFAHPAFVRSKINAAMRSSVESLDDVTFHDLYSHYPDFLIDVQREQQLCVEHDVIIFQHPFYWYSTPSILKEWQDLVLQHNWAYGSKGRALEGKYFLQAFTAGAASDDYQHDGLNQLTLTDLLTPFRAMARLCKMQYLPPFTVLGIHRGLPESQINNHAEAYRQAVIGLRDEAVDLSESGSFDNLISFLDIDQPGRT